MGQGIPGHHAKGHRLRGGVLIKPFHCRNKLCQKDIALTDGGRLYVSKMAIISEQVIYTCAHCDYYSRWIRLENPTGELSDEMQAIPNPFALSPDLAPLPCPVCKGPVALTDGIRIYASGLVISCRVVYLCLHCGKDTAWKPPLAPRKTLAQN